MKAKGKRQKTKGKRSSVVSCRLSVVGKEAVGSKPRGQRLGIAFFLPALVFLIFTTSISAVAQSGRKITPPPDQPDKNAIRIETREVHLPLRAYDPLGKEIIDLKPEELLVLEDGRERQITSLRRQPASIVLVLDLNIGIGTFKNGPSRHDEPPKEIWQAPKKEYSVLPNPAAREMAQEFVRSLAPADSLAIIQYADKVQLIQDWTLNRRDADDALKSKFRMGLKAAFHDALILAAEKLRSRDTGRRIIVLVSDGVDNNSRKRQKDAFLAVERAGATVFVISWTALLRNQIESAALHRNADAVNQARVSGVPVGNGPIIDHKRNRELAMHLRELDNNEIILGQLAEESGGEILRPENFDEFYQASAKVMGTIGEQYTLAYLTDRLPLADAWRTVQINSRRPGITLRTRQRYELTDDISTRVTPQAN
jgi:VWFA-related protein